MPFRRDVFKIKNIEAKIRDRRRERERLEQRLKQEEEERRELDERIKHLDERLNLISEEKEELGLIAEKVTAVLDKMERNKIHEYVDLINNKKKLVMINIIIGISRGFGTVIGVTIVAAIFIYILQQIISLGVPVIGDFIAEIVKIVQENLN